LVTGSRTALVGIACVLAAGCGGGESDEAKVRSTVKHYYQDVLNPEILSAKPVPSEATAQRELLEEACSFLTEAEKRVWSAGVGDCPTATWRYWRSSSPGDIARVKRVIATDLPVVTVCGDHAALDYPGQRILLVQVDDEWYIDRFSTPLEAPLPTCVNGG
jgi:hypothetical protein